MLNLKPVFITERGWLDIGLPFRYKGDLVIYKWPWKKGPRWLSLFASGTGEFGDACFDSLKAMDTFWDSFSDHLAKTGLASEECYF